MELIALTTLRVDGEKVLAGESFEVGHDLGWDLIERGLAREAEEEILEAEEDAVIDLDELTVEELKHLAKDRDIKGYSTMRKDELIEAILLAEDG